MKKNKEALFPDLDYKKLKVVDPERKARFPEIKLIHFLVVVALIAFAVAYYSQSTRQSRRPPPTARDVFVPPPGIVQPGRDLSRQEQRGQEGFSLSY